MARVLMRVYLALSLAVCAWGVWKVYAHPPASMKVTKDGVPYFTPPVIDPITGKPLPVETLVRHYKGVRP
ncbi:MAG: hypothetical protein K6T56_05075 [Burkholderiales bacterium]|jgi:hypothetical protein|nr:hypothetical protein [Burkholderiales bacterium]